MKTLPSPLSLPMQGPERGGIMTKIASGVRTSLKSSPQWVKSSICAVLVPPVRSYIRFAPTGFIKGQLWTHIAEPSRWLAKRVHGSTVFGADMVIDARDIVGQYIYYFGVWEPALSSWITSRLRTGDVFVDVGAYIGYFSLLAAKAVGHSGRVVSIEPAPQVFDLLAANVRMNRTGNIRCENIAAWDREAKLRLFTKRGISVSKTTVHPQWASRYALESDFEVQAKPLHKTLSAQEISAARLIKIDVECAEWQVIAGLMPVLKKCRPDLEIIVEVTNDLNESNARSPNELIEMFREVGFCCYHIKNNYSGLAYLSKQSSDSPKRLDRLSSEQQTDLIFSRVDASELSLNPCSAT
jgi:FkbM family methyltransferase